ncbi:MAG: tyrosine-type recombinase/integrase [Burkholderiales bacterium]
MGGKRKFDGVRAISQSTIEIDFYYAGKRCRERIRLEPTPANLKRASNHRAAILDAIDRGTFDYAVTFPESNFAKKLKQEAAEQEANVLTVSSYLDDWLERKFPTLKSSTANGYLKIVNGHLIPQFGKRPLNAITRSEIKSWAAKLQCGNKSIANILSCFRAALQEAFEDEIIEQNPLAGWVYRKAEPPKDEDDIDPFTFDEQAAILDAMTGQGRNLIQFAFWTGLRTSELVALNWSDIDWKRGIVSIRRAQTQASKGIMESTKTRAGTREVKLLPPAMDALNSQKALTYPKRKEIFQNPRTGERWTGDQPIRRTLWMPALRNAGVRYRNPYQTRHTWASMMLSAGEHPMWVASQMGHKDWGMIRRHYGRWIPDTDPSAGGRAVAQFMSRNSDQTVEI